MKIAFVGFGAQTRENLIPACRTIPGVKISAICDIDELRRNEAAVIFGPERVFSDHREMMDKARPDAVIAACYPADHVRIALDAIERRIPVFIEKPLAPSSERVRLLADLAERNNVVTGVGMNFRFAEVTRRLAEIAEGQFNTICLRQFANKPVGTLWGYTSPLRSFLHAQTIHGLDMLIHLCGPVRDINVVHSNRGSRIVFTAMLEFESGAHGSLITSNTSPHFTFDFDAICHGRIHVSSSSLWNLTVAELGKAYTAGERKRWRDSWEPSPLVSGFDRSGYLGELTDFISAIGAGLSQSKTAFSTLIETYRCLDLIEEQCVGITQLPAELAS